MVSFDDKMAQINERIAQSAKALLDYWDSSSFYLDDKTTDYDHYTTLRDILDEAYDQAATGKGKERHANDRPWSAQPIAEIGRMVGVGFNLGQAMKKLQEASRMEGETAVRELLGAIVYAASAIMLIRDGSCDTTKPD